MAQDCPNTTTLIKIFILTTKVLYYYFHIATDLTTIEMIIIHQ